jgi:hypothetical protein
MQTFIATCLGILTLTHLIVLAALVAALLQVRRTALAVETLARETEGHIAKLGAAADTITGVVCKFRSGWLHAFATGLRAVFESWRGPSNRD